MEFYRHLQLPTVSILRMFYFTDIGITDEGVLMPPPVNSKLIKFLRMLHLLLLVLQMDSLHLQEAMES